MINLSAADRNKVEVRFSPIHGKGIFAVRPFKKGEAVFVVRGPIISYKEEPDWRIGADWLQVGCAKWKIAYKNNPWIYINHSCNPNVGLCGNNTVVALRQIKKGEEILIDYSFTEASTNGWKMKCRCGDNNCRHIIRSIQFLPLDIYQKYQRYIPLFLKKEYKKCKVYVRELGNDTTALFARQDINKNDTVFVVKGPVIKYSRPPHPHIGYKWLGLGKNLWMVPERNNFWTFFRHSCSPNVGLKKRTHVVAMRNIKIGEEITIDDAITELDMQWKRKCSCGSKNCRKIIRSIQFLPTSLFQRYLPYIPTVFQEAYKKFNKNIAR